MKMGLVILALLFAQAAAAQQGAHRSTFEAEGEVVAIEVVAVDQDGNPTATRLAIGRGHSPISVWCLDARCQSVELGDWVLLRGQLNGGRHASGGSDVLWPIVESVRRLKP